MRYPDVVSHTLLRFLSEFPVQKNSEDWEAIQVAIMLIIHPSLIKQGVHVFINSYYRASEEGCYDIKEMSIKIYKHKIVLRRSHSEYDSLRDIDYDQTYRYIYPNERYNIDDFENVMDDLSDLFHANYCIDDSDSSGHSHNSSNFHIETNAFQR